MTADVQTPQNVDDWNKEAALANAEKAAIEAELALGTARKARADALHPDPTKAANDAKIAAANAQKAVSDAETSAANSSKAKFDADAAALKAQIGDIPTSGYTGAVDLKDKAGSTEAALLAAKAINSAAEQIIKRKAFGDAVKSKEVWIYAMSELPNFDSLLVYRTYSLTVSKALDDAEMDAKKKLMDGKVTESPSAEFVPAEIGLSLDAASRLLSFFKTDYTVGGLDAAYDDSTLVHSIAGKMVRGWTCDDGSGSDNIRCKAASVKIPSLYNQAALTDSNQEIFKQLNDWTQRVAKIRDRMGALGDRSKALADETAQVTDMAKKNELTEQSKACTDAVISLAKGVAIYETVTNKLSSTDDKGVVPIAATIRENSIFDLLSRRGTPQNPKETGRVVIVKVQKAGGAYYTRRNIWTILGGMPLWHMGGTVVSFVLLGDEGTVLDAGLIPLHGGFVRAGDLQSTLEPGSN